MYLDPKQFTAEEEVAVRQAEDEQRPA